MPDLTAINQSSTTDPTNTDPIPGAVDVNDLLVEVSLIRYGALSNDLLMKTDDIKANNSLLTQNDDALKQVDAQVSSTGSDGSATISVSPQVLQELAAGGVSYTSDNKLNDATGQVIPNQDGTLTITVTSGQKTAAFLKDQVQALSNNSQMDMIQLQSQMNNLNQTMETATSIMQKASDTKDKIIQNIH